MFTKQLKRTSQTNFHQLYLDAQELLKNPLTRKVTFECWGVTVTVTKDSDELELSRDAMKRSPILN